MDNFEQNHDDIINELDKMLSDIQCPCISNSDIALHLQYLKEIIIDRDNLEDCVDIFYKTFK